MEILDIDSYFELLKKCTHDAFLRLDLNDYYPTDGTKAIWDISRLEITKPDGALTEIENKAIRNSYIKENMRTIFLEALESYSQYFQSNGTIQRAFFYKKCYEALMFKITKSELWNKPDFGFNIDAEPDVLSFLWNMRFDIEARSKEHKVENIPLTLNDYLKHYIETGSFGFTKPLLSKYKSSQFDELSKLLTETKKRYDYIFNNLNDSQRIEFKNDFCDKLTKLKSVQSESKNIEIIQNLYLKINNEYNHNQTIKSYQINEYKTAIIGNFEMTFEINKIDGLQNPFYYNNQILNFIKDKNEYLKTNIKLKNNSKELLIFNDNLKTTLIETFKLFQSAYNYNIDELHFINEFNISHLNVLNSLEHLKKFAQSINLKLLNSQINSSIYLKNYCVTQFKEMISFLNSDLSIHIEKSPLKDKFDEVLKELENSISIPEIEILMKTNNQTKNEQPESEQIEFINEPLRNNFNANHFNNDGYDLFCYLIDNYNKKGIIKFINIYYFLKNEVKKDKYSFNFIQKDYTSFIQKNHQITIKKYEKAKFDFDEQKRILNALEEQFRTQKFK